MNTLNSSYDNLWNDIQFFDVNNESFFDSSVNNYVNESSQCTSTSEAQNLQPLNYSIPHSLFSTAINEQHDKSIESTKEPTTNTKQKNPCDGEDDPKTLKRKISQIPQEKK